MISLFTLKISRSYEDFKKGSKSKQIQEARYDYYLKKKKAKIIQLKEILVEKRKEKGLPLDDKLFQSINKGQQHKNNRQYQTLTSPDNHKKSKSVMNLNKTVAMGASSVSNAMIQGQEYRNLIGNARYENIFKTQIPDQQVLNLYSKNYSPDTKKPHQGSDGAQSTPRIDLERKFGRMQSLLDVKELVVNQDPTIPLKVSLDFKNPELFINQKINNLEKMTNAMVKLDNLADESKNKFEHKLKERKNKVLKLKELLEIEEYEREKRILKEKERQRNAVLAVEKQQRELEKRAFIDYQQYMTERQRLQKEKEAQELNYQKIKLKENHNQFLKEQEQRTYRQQMHRIEEEEAQVQLEQIDKKLQYSSQKYLQTVNQVKKQRNDYSEKHQKVYTNVINKMLLTELNIMEQGKKKLEILEDKSNRVYEDRSKTTERLQKINSERLMEKRRQREQILKQNLAWSQSVLEKHRKQIDQVHQRNQSIEEYVKAKREYNTLRFQDQNLNYSDILDEKKRRQELILRKHEALNRSLMDHRKKYEDLQQSQRIIELNKKKELFSDYQYQSLKPQNKLLEVSLKKQILNEEPVARSRVPILNIKFTSITH